MSTAGEYGGGTSPWRGGANGRIPTARIPQAVPEGPVDTDEAAVDDTERAKRASKQARQQRNTMIAGYIGLFAVVAITAAMSWKGLTGFGHDVLHLPGKQAWGVPVSLDMAAMVCGALALRSVVLSDSAAGPRLLTFLLVAGSAGANWYHADRGVGGSTAAASYYAAMSVVSWALWEIVLRQIRRSMLKSIGAVERPLPKFRIVRWLRYPRETFAAWSVSVRFGLTRPDEALERVWETYEAQEAEQELRELEELERLPDGVTKRQAIELAFKALKDTNAPAAVEWCKERGVEVDRSYAYEVARKIEPRELEVAG
ncbi:DUF2637 domain-containing protein [Streptomyces xanthochromogenes]|uniref:DUF2637 domain-containing protein n=1 Tax=Streptomyces xanthochromogenes TaxID=67384 RepID=UPI0038123B70